MIYLISYKPLWATMSEKGVSTYQLLQKGVDNHTLQNLKENKNLTMLTAEKPCNILNCCVGDIVEFINENNGT